MTAESDRRSPIEKSNALPKPEMAEICRTVSRIFSPGDAVELRVPKAGRDGTIAGYFDDFHALAEAACTINFKAPAVYVTMNPVNPILLARAVNRVKMRVSETATDRDVLLRRWLLIDCDPKRPSGISSTDTEHELVLARAREIRRYLTDKGWPEPIFG